MSAPKRATRAPRLASPNVVVRRTGDTWSQTPTPTTRAQNGQSRCMRAPASCGPGGSGRPLAGELADEQCLQFADVLQRADLSGREPHPELLLDQDHQVDVVERVPPVHVASRQVVPELQAGVVEKRAEDVGQPVGVLGAHTRLLGWGPPGQ